MTINDISGNKGKGGGGGGGGYSEAPNTLRSLAVVRVLEAISEGPIVGLVTGDAQSIFFNDTPVQNADATYNFNAIKYEARLGLPSQPYMVGFPAVESVVNVGTAVTTTTPVVKGVSSAVVDAVRVTIQLPSGLSLQDTGSGSLNGTEVQVAIDRQPNGSGIWETVTSPTISGKTMTPYEKDYRIERPANTSGLWNVRVRRITEDATGANVHNATAFARFTEIQDVKLEYDYTAYVGVAVDAQSTGGQVPVRSYLIKGLIVSVPTNYDPETHTYTGQWNGTFKQAWTDNPAWVLYDILTNVRYGMGEFIRPEMIDKFSFYDAGVYNDHLVPDGKGGQEPRFTFNYVVGQQEDAIKVLQAIASTMRATLMYSAGLLWINQDRPSDPVKLVTKANVIDGKFTYSSTPLQQRHTVARVTYNDKTDRYMPAVTTVESATGINRYGYNPTDVAAYGAVTEGQAVRHGKWILETELNTTELVSYKSSFNQFDLRVGDVMKLYDEDYTQTAGAGRLVSASSNSFTLDRAVTLNGASTIDVFSNDGKTINTYTLTQTSGTHTVVTTTGSPSFTAQHNDYIISSTVAPRLFRVMNIKLEGENFVTVQAATYDPTKYDRVEQDFTIAPPVYTPPVPTGHTVCGPVTNITGTQESFADAVGIKVGLRVDWTPASTKSLSYKISYCKNNGQWSPEVVVTQPSYLIQPVEEGTYTVQITAYCLMSASLPVRAWFTVTYSTNGNPPTPAAVTDNTGNHGVAFAFSAQLFVYGSGTASGNDVDQYVWGIGLEDFKKKYLDAFNAVVLPQYRTSAFTAVGSIFDIDFKLVATNGSYVDDIWIYPGQFSNVDPGFVPPGSSTATFFNEVDLTVNWNPVAGARGYKVEVWDTGELRLRRTETVTGTQYVYTLAKNTADIVSPETLPSHALTVKIFTVDVFGTASATGLVATHYHRTPGPLINATMTGSGASRNLTLTPMDSSYDTSVWKMQTRYTGFKIWAVLNSGYQVRAPSNLVYSGNSLTPTIGVPTGAGYLHIMAYDEFCDHNDAWYQPAIVQIPF